MNQDVEKIKEWLESNDVSHLSDWEVSDLLKQVDYNLQPKITVFKRLIGFSEVLETIGVFEGSNFFEDLKMQAEISNNIAYKYLFSMFENSKVDVSNEKIHDAFKMFVEDGLLTQDQTEVLKSLSISEEYQSWAQANNVEVDPRNVGLARGGKP